MLPAHVRQPHSRSHNYKTSDNSDDSDNDGDNREGDQAQIRYPQQNHRSTIATTLGTNTNTTTVNRTTAPPPLGLTGVVCESHCLTVPGRGRLHYTVYRPRQLLHSPYCHYKPPLVCVPGGPLIPCNYLQSLVYTVTDRAVVLYDPIGCGQSILFLQQSTTTSTATTTITPHHPMRMDEQVQDLQCLVQALKCPQFHLLGHSFGGLVVYEYLVQLQQSQHCACAILASAPASTATSRADSEALVTAIVKELRSSSSTSCGSKGNADNVNDDLTNDAHVKYAAHDVFWSRHECRISPMPYQLQQAFTQAKVQGTGSSITNKNTMLEYTATNQQPDGGGGGGSFDSTTLPPVLVLRGQYDFVTTANSHDAWSRRIPNAECWTIAGTSHYGMVEQEELFGSCVTAFLQKNDPPPATAAASTCNVHR